MIWVGNKMSTISNSGCAFAVMSLLRNCVALCMCVCPPLRVAGLWTEARFGSPQI